jgi:hypothetical protein
MNYSIYSLDRATHLKIVVLALLSATAVAGLTLLLHSHLIVLPVAKTAVLKAGTPVAAASSSIVIVR